MASSKRLNGHVPTIELRRPIGGLLDRMVEQVDLDCEIALWKEAIWDLIVTDWVSFPFGDDFIIDWYDQLNGE